jgi:uncharacterized membrane protein YqgA involved in biofilm formation
MTGMLFNVFTVVLGTGLGLLVGSRLPERIQQSVMTALGLTTLYLGISNAGASGNIIIPVLALVAGVVVGELLDLDGALNRFGGWLQARVTPRHADADGDVRRARFITGFVTASLIYCIGPLAFAGSILDGMGEPIGFQQIAIKSILDGFASIAFASSLGIGVGFSVIPIILVQGGFSLLGMAAGEVMTDPMIAEMTSAGGIILMGLSLVLLEIKHPRVANFLPALAIAPLMVAVASALGINIYPL